VSDKKSEKKTGPKTEEIVEERQPETAEHAPWNPGSPTDPRESGNPVKDEEK
jgi:hypothetical protein